jgi:hypothetical protein
VGFEARPVKTRRRDDTVATGWDWQTGPHPPLCLSSARSAKFQPSQTRVLQAVHNDGSYTQQTNISSEPDVTWSSEPRLWYGTFTRRPWSPMTPVSAAPVHVSRDVLMWANRPSRVETPRNVGYKVLLAALGLRPAVVTRSTGTKVEKRRGSKTPCIFILGTGCRRMA